MFSIQICYVLAASSGMALGLTLLMVGGVLEAATLSEIWNISGHWHESRALEMLANSLHGMIDNLGLIQMSPATLGLVVFIVGAAIVNAAVAILGWRSIAAIRGFSVHCLLVTYYCAATIFIVLMALWVVHWLNFWAFLILLVAIEIRRREEGGTRLSF